MEDYAAYSVIILINLLHCFMRERERGRGRDRETEGRSTYAYRGYVSSLRVEKGKLDYNLHAVQISLHVNIRVT